MIRAHYESCARVTTVLKRLLYNMQSVLNLPLYMQCVQIKAQARTVVAGWKAIFLGAAAPAPTAPPRATPPVRLRLDLQTLHIKR